jgi:hypothetical protein
MSNQCDTGYTCVTVPPREPAGTPIIETEGEPAPATAIDPTALANTGFDAFNGLMLGCALVAGGVVLRLNARRLQLRAAEGRRRHPSATAL